MRLARREQVGEVVYWWFVRPMERRIPVGTGQLLDPHLTACASEATSIASALGLADWEREALVMASAVHDLGKGRKVWQRAAGNDDTANAVAKPLGRMTPSLLDGYRHELGSIIDVIETGAMDHLDPLIRDLATWLVAAHHGRARPHFSARETFDPERSDEAAADAALRSLYLFDRLQHRLGRWRLAYLQAIRLAADIASEKDHLS